MVINIKVLICHRDIDLALIALKSLAENSAEPVGFTFHDDGSLSDGDQGQLRSNFAGCTIISREHADEFADTALREKYPHCYYFRQGGYGSRNTPLKILDALLMHKEDYCVLCDSDVLFFRPFFISFSDEGKEIPFIFMRDSFSAYSFSPQIFKNLEMFGFPSRLNAGFLFFRKKYYDLDYLEYFLRRFSGAPLIAPWWLEQNLWAALVAHAKVTPYFWDPVQVKVIEKKDKLTPLLIAGHFTTGLNDDRQTLIKDFLSAKKALGESTSVKLKLVPNQQKISYELSLRSLRYRARKFFEKRNKKP